MPEWLRIIILGIVEGVTEFLPVSSTGHLLLVESFFGVHQTEFFNTLIQSGAVLAVLLVFAKRAQELLFGWSRPENKDYLLKLGAAFLLTAIGGLILKKGLHWHLPKTAVPVAWATLIGGFAIVGVEAWLKDRKGSSQITWTIAIVIGIAQLIAAVFPGSSRSGTTILFAMALGIARPAATEFSFLLGIPTLLAAGAKETLDAVKSHEPHESWSLMVLGMVVAAVTAFLVVRWLLGYVRNNRFTPFGWYRIILGAVILVLAAKGLVH